MPNMQMSSVRRIRMGRACLLLGVERWRLKDWVKKNWVPHSKSASGQTYFSSDDIRQIRESIKFDAQQID
jgi:predicted site-specific integrase-resolvase